MYFEEYSKNDIHKIMCSDNIRVAAYKDALALLAKGKSVLDIGSGTGVLSFAAVKAGASRIYAVEKADIYKSCNKEIKKRGLENKVKVMNCTAEEAPLEGIKMTSSSLSGWGTFCCSSACYLVFCKRVIDSLTSRGC